MHLIRSNIIVLGCPRRAHCHSHLRLTCTKPQHSRIDSEQICERGEAPKERGRRNGMKQRGRQRGRYNDGFWSQQAPLRCRCFLTQHNVTTIVLKLAAAGYSAAAFPCKAFPDEAQTEKSSRGCRRPLCILIAP